MTGDDRPALGVAHVRRRFGAGRRASPRSRPSACRRATRSTCSRAQSDASVKVRDGLMDVKQLERVDDDGLEQWRPVLKAAFPLAADDVATVLDALGVAAPRSTRTRTRSTSSSTSCSAGRRLRAVDVHKRARALHGRRLHGGADRARPPSGLARARSRSSRRTRRGDRGAVRELGLARRPNTCVAARAEGARSASARARYAVIDVGTNSVKFHVGERAADGAWTTVVDRAEVTRLGEGLDETGELGDGADRAHGRRDRGHGRRGARARRRRRSPPSAPPACGSRRTAPRSSTPSASAPASRSR